MRKYYLLKKAESYERMRLWRDRKRKEFLQELGGKCVHCGVDNLVVLDFDHIHNDAYKDKKYGRRACILRLFSKYGIDKNRFQLLCKNCNWIKEFNRRKDAQQIKSTSEHDASSRA